MKTGIALNLRKMVAVAQLVRASDCGSEGRGFETPQSPIAARAIAKAAFFRPGSWAPGRGPVHIGWKAEVCACRGLCTCSCFLKITALAGMFS